MFADSLITTVPQKVLRFLAKYPDKEFYEREITRRIGISTGSANRAVNELFLLLIPFKKYFDLNTSVFLK
jgi:hypothetical protein